MGRKEIIENLMIRMGVEKPVVSDNVISYFKTIPNNVLMRPLVLEMLENGFTLQQVAIKFGVTKGTVEWIKDKKKELED